MDINVASVVLRFRGVESVAPLKLKVGAHPMKTIWTTMSLLLAATAITGIPATGHAADLEQASFASPSHERKMEGGAF